MKKNDIIIIAICVVLAGGALFFVVTNFSGTKKTSVAGKKSTETIDFTGNFDDSKVDDLMKRKDYGSLPTNNIGRQNPFTGF